MTTTPEPQASKNISVVGIGASAGGIEALRDFFSAVPADLGLAYVVVVHLAPDHESELANILSHCTKMKVAEVNDHNQIPLQPNTVYVIAPDRRLEITETTICALPFTEARDRRA